MNVSADIENGERMPRGRAWRLGAAVLSGPVLLLSLRTMDWQHLKAYSGPLWLDAEELAIEAIHSFGLTLMVAVSFSVYRLLSLGRPARDAAFYLPVLLWGFQAAVFAYQVFYSSGHWSPEGLLFLNWLVGIVTFLVLGVVLLLVLPSTVTRSRGRRVARIGFRTLALAGVVVTTVFLDWTLMSTQTSEIIIVPALASRPPGSEGSARR